MKPSFMRTGRPRFQPFATAPDQRCNAACSAPDEQGFGSLGVFEKAAGTLTSVVCPVTKRGVYPSEEDHIR
jgi:hypothetical protein